jgi:hypothetical protein
MLQNKTTFKFSLTANPINKEMHSTVHIGLALSESLNVVLFCIRKMHISPKPSDEPSGYTKVIYLRAD